VLCRYGNGYEPSNPLRRVNDQTMLSRATQTLGSVKYATKARSSFVQGKCHCDLMRLQISCDDQNPELKGSYKSWTRANNAAFGRRDNGSRYGANLKTRYPVTLLTQYVKSRTVRLDVSPLFRPQRSAT
jgi:hypothetical protein